MAEFETKCFSSANRTRTGRKKTMISAVEEGKSKEHVMPGRKKRNKNEKQKALGIVCDAKLKKCLKISLCRGLTPASS